MSVLASEIRPGSYVDSIVLMQLQSTLLRLAGIRDAGVVMGTAVNLELLRASELLDDAAAAAGPEDLVITLRADDLQSASDALAQVDDLLRRDRSSSHEEYRPKSLTTALRLADARPAWVSISVPGRWADPLARQALSSGCHVFLYSDNVDLEQEIELKAMAAQASRLLMGPDCGSALIGGFGFGFTNQVRTGSVGVVAASGTGLQAVTSELHRLGSGVSHAIGTGGRDLSTRVAGATAMAGLDLLARDDATRAIVLISKPPDATVGARLLSTAFRLDKPVVVYFTGFATPGPRFGRVQFARSFEETAALAAVAATGKENGGPHEQRRAAAPARFLRGLFAGGTLAQEVLQCAVTFLSPVHSNLHAAGALPLPVPTHSSGHTILDLGADDFTVGRPHPMIDQRLRLERLRQEAADPETAVLFVDVVLGRGAHPDPAAELAPRIAEIHRSRDIEIIALVVGTDEDPQSLESTCERLATAGAAVCTSVRQAFERVLEVCPSESAVTAHIESTALERPRAVVNVGLQALYESSMAQEVATIQMDWRPPAGGNEAMIALLERTKS